jgi:hypothetical protein
MKNFCLPGLPYSHCHTLPFFPAIYYTSAMSGHTRNFLRHELKFIDLTQKGIIDDNQLPVN